MTAEIKKRRFAEGVIVTNPTDLNVGSGGGGSGGVNLNINPNASLALDNSGTNDVGDWLDSGAGTTLSRETTTFPLGDTVTSAIKISFLLVQETIAISGLRFLNLQGILG